MDSVGWALQLQLIGKLLRFHSADQQSLLLVLADIQLCTLKIQKKSHRIKKIYVYLNKLGTQGRNQYVFMNECKRQYCKV